MVQRKKPLTHSNPHRNAGLGRLLGHTLKPTTLLKPQVTQGHSQREASSFASLTGMGWTLGSSFAADGEEPLPVYQEGMGCAKCYIRVKPDGWQCAMLCVTADYTYAHLELPGCLSVHKQGL